MTTPPPPRRAGAPPPHPTMEDAMLDHLQTCLGTGPLPLRDAACAALATHPEALVPLAVAVAAAIATVATR